MSEHSEAADALLRLATKKVGRLEREMCGHSVGEHDLPVLAYASTLASIAAATYQKEILEKIASIEKNTERTINIVLETNFHGVDGKLVTKEIMDHIAQWDCGE